MILGHLNPFRAYPSDESKPQPIAAKKEIEVIIEGEKYSSLQAYKKEKLIRQIKREVFLSEDESFQVLFERILLRLSPQALTSFSKEELFSLVRQFYDKKREFADLLSENQQGATEISLSQEDEELQKMVTDYMEEYGEVADIDIDFDKMKTIILPSPKQ